MVLLLGVLLTSVSAPGQDLTRDGDSLIFANQVIQLRIDVSTGQLTAAGPLNGPAVVSGSSADIRLGESGNWLGDVAWKLTDSKVETGPNDPAPPPWMVGDPEAKPTGTALALTMSAGEWRRIDRWRLWPDEPFAARTVSWIWQGDGAPRIDGTRLMLRGVTLPDSELVFPADFPVSRGPLRNGPIPRGSQNNQLAVIETADTAVLALAAGVAEPVSGYVNNGAIIHQFGTQLIAQSNQPFEVGAQVLALSGSGPEAVAEVTHRVDDRFGLRLPTDTPGIEQTVLYSAHAGGTIGSGFRDTGGFVEMTKRLTHLRELGFNCLWLLPFWKGAVYAPSDYYALDPSLGTEADLKALCDEAHRLGMKVLGDLIPHGPREFAELIKQHPDVATYNADGSLKMMWGCLQCDYAQPAWQQYMADHAVYWMKQVGLDGYRVDVAFGGPPNWQPAPGVRPSMSQAYGARKLLATVRAAMKAQDPNSLLLMEGTAPGLFESGDIVYDFPWTYSVLPRSIDMPGEEWVPAAKEWLAWQDALYPRGARFLHYVSSHDTIRGAWRYGPAHHRVLLAINACLPGVPMVYDDEEVGQSGLRSWLKREEAYQTLPDPHPERWVFGTDRPKRVIDLKQLTLGTGGYARDLAWDKLMVKAQNTPEQVVVDATWYRLKLDPRHGGMIQGVFSNPWPDHEPPIEVPAWIGPVSLTEGRRKLRVGSPPGDLLDWVAEPAIETNDDEVRITFRSPAGVDPAVVREYRCDWGGFTVNTTLRFADGLDGVNASLTERLPWLYSWQIGTWEGTLSGRPEDLRAKAATGQGFRYRHDTKPAWSHRQFPAPLADGWLYSSGAFMSMSGPTADRPGWVQDVTLTQEGLDLGWLAEREPVTLAPGEPVRLSYAFGMDSGGGVSHTNSGPRHVTETPNYRLAIDRSSGGTITELRRKTVDGWGPSFVDGLVSYTDHGIYGPYRDPAGVEHPTNAKSDYDIEPDVTLSEADGRKAMLIEGTFRTPYADGRSIARPYTFYRHGFTTDDSDTLELRLGLRIPGGFESGDTPIFASHILRLRDVKQVTIQAGGKTLVHDAADKDAGRVWQSKAAKALPESITVKAAGGTMVLTPLSGTESLQNIFLYDSGGGRMTLFLAPFDLEPVKALPIWKECRWRIALQP